MRSASTLFVFSVLSTFLASAHSFARRDDDITDFKPPNLKPFLHLQALANLPSNASTIFGLTARKPNTGGTCYLATFHTVSDLLNVCTDKEHSKMTSSFTGVLEGGILALGAAIEILPPTSDSESFYTNKFSLNTTAGQMILMETKATIHYANNALHGFGSVSFQTDAEGLVDLSYGSYVSEFVGDFNTGKAGIDVFELESAGRRDGAPVPALLPPGEAAPPATTTAAATLTSGAATGASTRFPCRRGHC